MAGFESNEPQQQQQVFSAGSEVEVRSDEEGFKGAWFRATIVQSPTNSASKKRKRALVEYKDLVTEDRSQKLKEYVDSGYIRPLPPQVGEQDFEEGVVVDADYRDGWWTGVIKKVLDNGSKYSVFFDNPPDVIEFERNLLRLHQNWVDGQWVRPKKQQRAGSIFSSGSDVEVNFDKENLFDAWFPAIVVKENEDNTFLVKYENSDARVQKDTVDFRHIRPPPSHYTTKSYELHNKVDAFYDFCWRAGVISNVLAERMYTIIFKHEIKGKELSFSEIRPLVEWKDGKWVGGSKEVLMASDSQQGLENVLLPENNFNHPEAAAQLENSGAAGENPESNNLRRNLMEQSSHPQSIRVINLPAPNGSATKLRPLKKLKDDKASEIVLSLEARQSKKKPGDKEMLHELATMTRGAKGTRRSRKPVVTHQLFKTESLLGEREIKTKQQRDGEVDSQWIHPIKSKGRRTKSQVGIRLTQEAGKEGYASVDSAGKIVQREGISNEAEVLLTLGSIAKRKDGSPAENPCQLPNEDLLKLMRDQKKNTNDPAQEKSMEFKQQEAGGSSHKRKRGRPRKLVAISRQASEGVKEQNGSGNVAEENVINDHTLHEVAVRVVKGIDPTDSQDASRRNTAEVNGTRCMTSEAATLVGASDNIDDDDRPLSMWFGGVQCPASVGESRPYPDRTVDQNSDTKDQVELARESPAIDAASDCVRDENQSMPFVKCSPVWKTIESLEVFRIMPQKPHFRPLGKCKEEYREGFAIGNMVTFSSLVEKVSTLHFDDPRNVFDSILESLLDLEKYGFNVTVLRGRVNELLSIKDRKGRFQGESKDAECKIAKHTHEKTKFVEEADCIAKEIIELQEKHASIKSEMEAKDLEISRLQLLVDDINKGIQSARTDFEKLAFAPLK